MKRSTLLTATLLSVLLVTVIGVLMLLTRPDPIPQELRRALESPRFDDRYAAVFELLDSEVSVRRRIGLLAEALEAELGQPFDGPRPHGSWFSASEVLLWNYASALGTGGEEAVSLLRRRERRARGDVREWLVLARGYADDRQAAEELAALLGSSSPAVRAEAARLLGEFHHHEAESRLQNLLEDPFFRREPARPVRYPVREAAAGALRQLGYQVWPEPDQPGRFEVREP